MIGDLFGVTHPNSTQFRFNDPWNPTGPSPHLSISDFAVEVLAPKLQVPTMGEFHVDPHGTTVAHGFCDLLRLCQ